MYLGFNGENFFEVLDDHTSELIKDMLGTDQRVCLRFRQDKEDSDPLDIDKLVTLDTYLKENGRGLDVIYCANIKEPSEVALIKLNKTIESGINVIAVEFGNEVYSKEQANFSFETYRAWFEPLYELIRVKYPELLCLVFLAPRPKESGVLGGRAEHSRFNIAAIEYINSKETLRPTVHIYFNSKECPVLLQRPANVAYDPDVFYPEWEEYYKNLFDQTMVNITLWSKTIDYINEAIPQKGIYITEWGYDEYGNQKNTMGTGLFAWTVWNSSYFDSRIVAMCQHNGPSKALPGMICPASPKDINPEGYAMLPRIDYYVLKLFMEYITKDNTYFPFYTTTSGYLDNAEMRAIAGMHMYSSAGATAWMNKNSIPSKDIPGIVEGKGAIALPGVNLGYYRNIVNIMPIADAGKDLTYYVRGKNGTASVILDGSNSYDEDGQIVLYEWFLEGKWQSLTGELSSFATSPTTCIDLPVGTHSVMLKVTDNRGGVGYATLIINIKRRFWWSYFFN